MNSTPHVCIRSIRCRAGRGYYSFGSLPNTIVNIVDAIESVRAPRARSAFSGMMP
jgi:hypothetical protein